MTTASNESFSSTFVLSNRRDDIEQAEEAMLQAVERLQYDRASLFAVRLALEEALSNAFKHGNKQDENKTVRLDCTIDSDAIVIDVQDQGDGFDPDCIPDPTENENVEIPCGRGLKLMRAFMTEVHIYPPGNRVRMKYIRPAEAEVVSAGT